MREFYVYGFKSRGGYTKKSGRTYDDERRRMESWLGDAMQFQQGTDGKKVFISIDSRAQQHNPLYRAWKAKSFTDGDITLHFILMDVLYDPAVKLSLAEIMDQVDGYLSGFEAPRVFDISTVRKKLNEYRKAGLITAEKRGKALLYSRAADAELPDSDLLDFFSETAPCGAAGSFLLDRCPPHRSPFIFKHHYITGTLDSDVMCDLLTAIREEQCVRFQTESPRRGRGAAYHAVPLRIMCSAQSGRQYLMAYVPRFKRIASFRLDMIISVQMAEPAENYGELQEMLRRMSPHLWGVSTQSWANARMEHVDFTVRYNEEESFIRKRMEREKRCGTLTFPDENTIRFSADVYDASELIPWMRTFIGRITEVSISNKDLEMRFREDIRRMYRIYGIGESFKEDLHQSSEGAFMNRDDK